MGDLKAQGKSKKRSNTGDPSSLYDLEAETERLKELTARLQSSNYLVPPHGDNLTMLSKLVDHSFELLRTSLDAVERERSSRTEKQMNVLIKAQKKHHLSTLEELRVQHEEELVREREELEREKEKSTCQICLENPRDVVILPCVHHLYCFYCLEAQKGRDNKCPSCRQEMNGMLKLRSCW